MEQLGALGVAVVVVVVVLAAVQVVAVHPTHQPCKLKMRLITLKIHDYIANYS